MYNNLFLKINYRINKNDLPQTIITDNNSLVMDKEYTKKQEKYKYALSGGFYKKNSASFIFKVKDENEAYKIMYNNPLVKNKKHRYELLNYNLFTIDQKSNLI